MKNLLRQLTAEMSDLAGAHPRILRRPEVEARTGLSRSTIYAGMKAGTFPRAVNLGKRGVGWLQREIVVWIESRVPSSIRGPMSPLDHLLAGGAEHSTKT